MKTIQKIISDSPYYEILKINDSSHHFPTHIHKRTCVGRVDAGAKVLVLHGEKQLLPAGAFFHIPPFTAHDCYTENGMQVSYTVFCFNDLAGITLERLKSDILTANIPITNIEQIYNYAHKVHKVVTVESACCNFIIEYIDKNFAHELSIDKIAQEVGLSKYHLIRIFKKNVGLSLHQYLIQTRIKKAAELMKNQNDLVTLALDTGFYDQSHFIRNFKKHIGTTPGNYSRIVKE